MRNIYLIICFLNFTVPLFAQDKSWPQVQSETKPFTRLRIERILDSASISQQLTVMAHMGIGGVEIDPAYGMGNENGKNLSEKWMKMFSFVSRKASELGMHVGIANGTGWPIGGPHVSDDNASTELLLQTFDASEGHYFDKKITPMQDINQQRAVLHTVMAFSNKGERIVLTSKVSSDGKLKWMPGEGKWKIVAAFASKAQRIEKNDVPGGAGFLLDLYSNVAFDNYTKRLEDAFSAQNTNFPKFIFYNSVSTCNADWSPLFLSEFKAKKEYNLENYLDLLAGFGNPGEIACLKSDYREVLAGMLIDNYINPSAKWLHSKGAIFRYQALGSAGNIIDLYAASDVPACAMFDSASYAFCGLPKDSASIWSAQANPFLCKFASSAAHIAGKRYVSSETFTLQGRYFNDSASQSKRQLDDLFISGVNHISFQGTVYFSKGVPWYNDIIQSSVEDFLPTDSVWKDFETMNAYITRCQSFLQLGQPDNDFLLYFPIYDIWDSEKGTIFPLGMDNQAQWLTNSSFYKAAKLLSEKGFSCDYISDSYLHKANTSSGKVDIGGNSYKAVIVPMSRFIPYESLKKIIDLSKNGATVLFVELPTDIPGFVDVQNKREAFQNLIRELALMPHLSKDKLAPFGKGFIAISGSLDRMLGYLNLPHENVLDLGIKYIRRKNESGYHYFMVNTKQQTLRGWVDFSTDARSAAIFDPLTGNVGIAKTLKQGGKFQVYLEMNPGQSLILRTYTTGKL